MLRGEFERVDRPVCFNAERIWLYMYGYIYYGYGMVHKVQYINKNLWDNDLEVIVQFTGHFV